MAKARTAERVAEALERLAEVTASTASTPAERKDVEQIRFDLIQGWGALRRAKAARRKCHGESVMVQQALRAATVAWRAHIIDGIRHVPVGRTTAAGVRSVVYRPWPGVTLTPGARLRWGNPSNATEQR